MIGGQVKPTGNAQLAIARLNRADGSLDPTFGSGGEVVKQLSGAASPATYLDTVALAADGSILASGALTESDDSAPLFVARLFGDLRPIARLSVSPGRLRAHRPVNFNAGGSQDPDGTIISYRWDFGDRRTATGPTAIHTYKETSCTRTYLTYTIH